MPRTSFEAFDNLAGAAVAWRKPLPVLSYSGSGDHTCLALSNVGIDHNSVERGAGVFFSGTAITTNEMHQPLQLDQFQYRKPVLRRHPAAK